MPISDLYHFNLKATLGEVTSYTAQIYYGGVPTPEEKFVNVYKLVYLRENDRVHAQVYKSPKEDPNYGLVQLLRVYDAFFLWISTIHMRRIMLG